MYFSLPTRRETGEGAEVFGFHGYTELRLLFFRSLEPRFISIRYGAFVREQRTGSETWSNLLCFLVALDGYWVGSRSVVFSFRLNGTRVDRNRVN